MESEVFELSFIAELKAMSDEVPDWRDLSLSTNGGDRTFVSTAPMREGDHR
jgi:hypothetical protein